MDKNYIFLKIIFLSFINQFFSKIVLPIEILPRENYLLIYPPNTPQDVIDSQNRNTYYTIFQLGSPIQKVPLLIKPKSNLYLITSANKTNISENINYGKYNFSKEFLTEYKYYDETKSATSKFNWCRENEYLPSTETCSFNDDILFYEALNMTIKKVNINFESLSNIDDNIAGEIGLNLYDLHGRSYNTFLGIIKQNELIDNYNLYFDFKESENQKGKIVIGSLPHEDYPSLFSGEELFFTNSLIVTGKEFMQLKFNKIYTNETHKEENITNEFNNQAELSYDSNIILSDIKYKYYLYKELNDLLNEKKCFNDSIRDFDYYRNHSFIYCIKDKDTRNKLNEIIKPIYFYSSDLNYTFEITPGEILKEKDDYIFIQILLNGVGSRWSLGKIFTLKYQFVFNQGDKQIGFYKKMNNQKHVDKEDVLINAKLIWITGSIILVCGVLVLAGYFIGKYVNKARKKRANELSDDYDYVHENKNENSDINNILVDENKNIN